MPLRMTPVIIASRCNIMVIRPGQSCQWSKYIRIAPHRISSTTGPGSMMVPVVVNIRRIIDQGFHPGARTSKPALLRWFGRSAAKCRVIPGEGLYLHVGQFFDHRLNGTSRIIVARSIPEIFHGRNQIINMLSG